MADDRVSGAETCPLASVVMPFYNGERYVAEALRSVAAQTYRYFELIIVDDGSRAAASDYVRQLLSTFQQPFKYIRQSNRGIAGAYNAGIAESAGEYISFIEQDDIWLPEKLSNDIGYLVQHPSAGMVHSRYWMGDAAGRFDQRVCSELTVQGHCFSTLFAMTLTGPTILPFSAVTMRRALLRRLGRLDEELKISVDYSTWLRAAYDSEVGFISSPAFIYRIHDANTSKNSLVALEDDCRIIEHWAGNREAVRILGRGAVNARLFRVYQDLAFAHATAGNVEKERAMRLKQLALTPMSPRAWAAWLGSWLHLRMRRHIAWYRSTLRRMLAIRP